MIVGDFNARLPKWFSGENNNTPRLEMDTFTSAAGYGQLIKYPVNFVDDSTSCTDSTFSTSKSLLSNFRVHPSL